MTALRSRARRVHRRTAMTQRTVLVVLAICSLSACREGDDGNVEDAAEGWRAAGVAMQGGQQEFEQEVDVGAEGEVTVGCPEGGDVTIDGRMEDQTRFDLNIAFAGCGADGVVIDGGLSLTATVKTTDDSAEVNFEYTGMLDFSGEVELSCTIDAVGRVAVESDGQMASAEASFSGRICGADASAVVEASS